MSEREPDTNNETQVVTEISEKMRFAASGILRRGRIHHSGRLNASKQVYLLPAIRREVDGYDVVMYPNGSVGQTIIVDYAKSRRRLHLPRVGRARTVEKLTSEQQAQHPTFNNPQDAELNDIEEYRRVFESLLEEFPVAFPVARSLGNREPNEAPPKNLSGIEKPTYPLEAEIPMSTRDVLYPF